MFNYDDDDAYFCSNYNYEDYVEPVSLISDEFSESVLTGVFFSAGLITEFEPWFAGSMEQLVFEHGEDTEIYSSAEICFIEQIDEVLVYPNFKKKLGQGNMICRAIAAKFDCSGYDALKSCISFEKIIDKALDGYNIFLFVTENSVFWGCRNFDKSGKMDCLLSNPIQEEVEFEQILNELSFAAEMDSFIRFYNHMQQTITNNQVEVKDYENVMLHRRGIQFSYLEDIHNIERDMGVNMSKEKERYLNLFDEKTESSFVTLLEEVDESLSFINSNRINAYEMLFEADEMIQQAEQSEREHDSYMQAAMQETNIGVDLGSDDEVEALLENPEEIIKLLKKRRGI